MLIRLVGANKIMLDVYDFVKEFGLSAPNDFIGRTSHEVLVSLPNDAALVHFITSIAKKFVTLEVTYLSNMSIDYYLNSLKGVKPNESK